eukprot:TRINITY_DN4212_c0_g2_i7.p1 TRINITY_DN4212_c0_g2~~TRINITY_DN4212_c0_g2_i7.p1  ORF type:complete len:916 (+),score=180.45 TRINITY_DN4212_c0_g2_i7:1189-3936(+)
MQSHTRFKVFERYPYTSTWWFRLAVLVQIGFVLWLMFGRSHSKDNRAHQHETVLLRPNDKDYYFAILGIFSDTTSSGKRTAIRETWLKSHKENFFSNKILHKFVIPLPHCLAAHEECDEETVKRERTIRDENSKFGDILRVEALEGEKTTSLSLCLLLEWVAEYNFEYFLRTDHDSFLRLDTIISELEMLPSPAKSYWSGFVFRDISLREGEENTQYELEWLPPYTSGPLHILSSDLVYALTTTLSRKYYNNLDQSFGLWLAPFNVTPKHDIRFQPWETCHPKLLAFKTPTAKLQHQMNRNLQDVKTICDGMDQERCPLCFKKCSPDQVSWGDSYECGEWGVTLKKLGGESHFDFDSLNREELNYMEPEKYNQVMMNAVANYLPYLTCSQRKLADRPLRSNYLANPYLDEPPLVSTFQWTRKGYAEVMSKGGLVDYEGAPSSCVRMRAGGDTENPKESYITQEIYINQEIPEPLVFSAWSKAVDVDKFETHGEYSLTAIITYRDETFSTKKTDNSPIKFTIPVTTLFHDWNYVVGVFNPVKPIEKVRVSCVFKRHKGTVWFDNIVAAELSHYLCELKFQKSFFHHFAPAQLGEPQRKELGIIGNQFSKHNHNVNHLSNDERAKLFISTWCFEQSAFKLRHRRAIESIFFHHPYATVKIYSNTLPYSFFHLFNEAGYDIEVIHYDVTRIGEGLPGENWARKVNIWREGDGFFDVHESTYVTFVALYKEGGVYLNLMDVIIVKPLNNLKTMLGTDSCDNLENKEYCIPITQLDSSHSKKYYFTSSLMSFTAGHPILHSCLADFDSSYDPFLPKLSEVYITISYYKYMQSNAGVQMQGSKGAIDILPQSALLPIDRTEIKQYFRVGDKAKFDAIQRESLVVNLWGDITHDDNPTTDSLIWGVLSTFSISSEETAENGF